MKSVIAVKPTMVIENLTCSCIDNVMHTVYFTRSLPCSIYEYILYYFHFHLHSTHNRSTENKCKIEWSFYEYNVNFNKCRRWVWQWRQITGNNTDNDNVIRLWKKIVNVNRFSCSFTLSISLPYSVALPASRMVIHRPA